MRQEGHESRTVFPFPFTLLFGESELLPTFWGCSLFFSFTCAWLKSMDTEAASHASVMLLLMGQVRDSDIQILPTCSVKISLAQSSKVLTIG